MRKSGDILDKEKVNEIKKILRQYNPKSYINKAKSLTRKFYIHVGPTNSGKTYDAIEALKKADTGVYLGPLRLLALEMADKLNSAGYPCNFITGEESALVNEARYTASTIEMLNTEKVYDVAIIDEAQLIADKDRGSAWTKAIYCVNAYEVHICIAPEALSLIIDIIESFKAEYTIVDHKRLAKLEFVEHNFSLKKAQPGDAIIAFSKNSVITLAAQLEKYGISASVIYGALPPEARRNEVYKFETGETDVVVATDAIGMGISLPIKRIIFFETEKFDGHYKRPLTPSEVRQIAGRAGRYGIYDKGEVLCCGEKALRTIKSKYYQKTILEEKITIPFPDAAIDSEYSLDELFVVWRTFRPLKMFKYQNVDTMRYLNGALMRLINEETPSKQEIYKLITCPVEIKNREVYYYWCHQSLLLLNGIVEEDVFDDKNKQSLEDCENFCKQLDLKYQMCRKFRLMPPNSKKKKEKVVKYINEILKEKSKTVKRCKKCGTFISITYPYDICNSCYRAEYYERKYYDYW